MKLVLVTAVEDFHKEVIKLFKKAQIKNFSQSDIEGYKTSTAAMEASNWFGFENTGNESVLFFSFTDEVYIDALFEHIKEFNKTLQTNNPIRAIVVPIEKSI
ncbi:hypothetical protein [Aestuariivivens sediminicola]|uniref:hypothetical protein n=1 Tax=Aestuariivivens sediminicola TaxID=2913560 RepID=UPI001F57211C|nr:hypothetical protein [Aestuariivivens sediminicola]